MAQALPFLADIERLTEQTPIARRSELLDAVSDIFLVNADYQAEPDSAALSEVMERVAYALEAGVRARLASKISRACKVSHRLILRLANDEIEVARPVLEHSPVLTESDLIEIIRAGAREHVYSIAGRDGLSYAVSDEIVEQADERILTRLAGNMSAAITEPGFGKIAARAGQHMRLLQTLGGRRDLPDAILRSVKSKLGGRLKSEAAGPGPDLDNRFVASLVGHCTQGIKLNYSVESIAELDRLHKNGAINEHVVACFAREKRIPELVYSLSLVTGIDDWSISQCLLRAELPALAILCKAHRFAGSTFLALAETRTGDAAVASSAMARAMRDYDVLAVATAERVMRQLRAHLSFIQKKKPEVLARASAAA